EVRLENGDVDLDAGVQVTFEDPDHDGRVTLLELERTGMGLLMPAGRFDASLDVVGAFGTYSASGGLTVRVDDMFHDVDPAVTFTASVPSLRNWKNLTAHD